MEKRPRERSWPADLADQTILIGCISRGNRNRRTLALLAYGSNAEVFLQRGFAPLVHNPSGSPDLGVVVGCDVVHQKIDQPAALLKNREEADDFSFPAIAGRLDRHRDWPGCLGSVLGLRFLATDEEDRRQQAEGDRQRSAR